MSSQVSPMLLIMSIAALALTLLFITSDAVGSAAPSADLAVHELVAATGDSTVDEPGAASPSGEPPFDGGFSLPIIHRNAPTSPLRDLTVTTLDLFRDEIKLASSPVLAEKMLVPYRFRRALYLVPLRIGGPLDRISLRYLMFDTASDLSWTQCAPCISCSRGHYPPYNPYRSSTFRSVSCDDPLCEHGSDVSCDASLISRQCEFERSYTDGSIAKGYLASDIFHFSIEGNDDYHFEPEVVFGCAWNVSSSTFVREYNTGLLALNFGSLSFVAQLRLDKFSYCVPAPPRRGATDQQPRTSYLRFGSEARMSGKRIPFNQYNYKYMLSLKSVTYQHGNRLHQQQPVPIYVGNDSAGTHIQMQVDSGTMGLWLPGPIYYALMKLVEADISLSRVPFLNNPDALCFRGNMADVEEVSVTLGFLGGDMELFGDSLFFEFENSNWIAWELLLTKSQR
ncbi:hypothetical protein PR202_gb04482 [Eleusine coracana subsp. coracana]|uniref:Peptidase A1 domain-containing protein n=1 Tax=Eleusine coracana subsp. coracana TaxID=191504 RepID=A0AAV5E4Q4_ELECO|nr:hypothetical protein PR202_gb04482 [Eleusine coracana subsp. coracana]